MVSAVSDEGVLNDLRTGQFFRFADWPNPDVPNWRAGVYTVWDGPEFLYRRDGWKPYRSGSAPTP